LYDISVIGITLMRSFYTHVHIRVFALHIPIDLLVIFRALTKQLTVSLLSVTINLWARRNWTAD